MRHLRILALSATALALWAPGARAASAQAARAAALVEAHFAQEAARAEAARTQAAAGANGAGRATASPPALSSDEAQSLRAFLDRQPDNTLVPVDLADPAEARMRDLIDRASGRAPFTALAAALAAAADPALRAQPCDEVLKRTNAQGVFADAGVRQEGQRALLSAATLQAVALQADHGVARNFSAELSVFDSDGKVVSRASGLSKPGEVTLVTQDPPAAGAFVETKPPMAVAYFTVFTESGTPCQARRLAKITPPPKRIAVTAPNNAQNRATILCLNRGAPQPGWPQSCDFGPFPQSHIEQGVAQVVVPLAGTIEMPYPIDVKTVSSDVTLQVTAINSNNGQTCMGQDNDLGPQVLQKVQLNGNALSWNIVGNDALVFGKTCYSPNTGLAFNMIWTVPVKLPDGSKQNVTAIVSNVLTQGSANTLIIRPAALQFGCLPGGTRVTLADGVTQKAIEAIGPEDRVLGPDGTPWAVTNHIKGDDTALIAVATEDGHVARMTLEHPVITGFSASGRPRFVLAKDLRAGDPVVTREGPSRAASVERLPYRGDVYNMEVRPLGAAAVPAGGGAFYADGLLVGDHTMQGLAGPGTIARND